MSEEWGVMRTVVYALILATTGAVGYYLSAELGISTSKYSATTSDSGPFELWKMILCAAGGLVLGGLYGYREDRKKKSKDMK